MDIKKFVLLEWIQRDLMIMKRISTSGNCSDIMTKQTGRQLFYRHFDYIMGRIIPHYAKHLNTKQQINIMHQNIYNTILEQDNHIMRYSDPPYYPGDNQAYEYCVQTNMEGISHLG